ncbi:hypothetical protein GCM10011416_03850 [Polaribacter pacificus]|uniref:Tetratricopeptide repeat-containing protein n=2 Tax=Polaribacter pacificus TaxID=1775173 RepID=A0A917HW93_9FLAO|nr:hypothetical protein GCM10011416_03850 [Polaribacter pacificus]
MTTKAFVHLLEHPNTIGKEETKSLKKIVDAYPFFQAARALHLKGLQKQESFRYNNELKRTAAFTTDRSILFDFITNDNQTQKEAPVQKIANTTAVKTTDSENLDLSLGKPIPFTANETHSFNEWLQLASYKTIDRSVKQPSKAKEKSTIIENFIKHNPKIIRIDKQTETVVKVTENKASSHLMTETLAKVYLEQKKYENAIKAYEILSLKYPEKSGFFADQIKRIRILQNNKS